MKKTGKRYSNEPLHVLTVEVAELILPLKHALEEEREREKSTSVHERSPEMGPASMREYDESGSINGSNYFLMAPGWKTLCDLVGIDHSSMRKVLFGQHTMPLAQADDWLTALDLGDRVHTLTTVPNPRWGQEKWMGWAEENGWRSCYWEGVEKLEG